MLPPPPAFEVIVQSLLLLEVQRLAAQRREGCDQSQQLCQIGVLVLELVQAGWLWLWLGLWLWLRQRQRLRLGGDHPFQQPLLSPLHEPQ